MPTITAILVLAESQINLSPDPTRSAVSVGVAAKDQPPAWGDCLDPSRASTTHTTPPSLAAEIRRLLEEAVRPALVGLPLDAFRPLAESLDALLDPDEPDSDLPYDPPSLDERFTAWVHTPSDSPVRLSRNERQANLRLVRRAVGYGVSQALLRAVAAHQGRSPARILSEEYHLPQVSEAVPWQARVAGLDPSPLPALGGGGLRSLRFNLPEIDPRSTLGEGGINVQRFIREVCARLSEREVKPEQAEVELGLHGGLGALFPGEIGKTLGALFGLEHAAAPFLLRVLDPVRAGSGDSQRAWMVELRGLVQGRKMSLGLAAEAWVESVADVEAWLEAGAVDRIHLRPDRLGGLHKTMEATAACRMRGVEVGLESLPGAAHRDLNLTCHLALAAQPSLFAVDWHPATGVLQARHEMARALAEVD